MEKYIKIMCILDRSGSMSSIINDAIGGFNTFLEEQKELDGKATIDIILFDDKIEKIVENIDIKEVENFNKNSYKPRGSTALYDAIGKTIDDEIDRLGTLTLEERPEKTLVVILTDGEENASIEYNKSSIKQIISEMREDFKWEFIFLAANQDACFTADSIGISKSNAMTFDYSGKGIITAYASISNATKSYRTNSDNSNLFEQ